MMTGLQVNPHTNEPFLRLRKHHNIIITPPRESDVHSVLSPMNDERVYKWFKKLPYPYLLEHSHNWFNTIIPICAVAVTEWTQARVKGESVLLTHSPVRFLREVQEDGTEIFLGDVGIVRCEDILLEHPKHDNATNLVLPPGHPDIIWTIGDFLVPDYHRRGIMTDAIDTLINDLAKPLLKAQHVIAMADGNNIGSGKVFLKNGFDLVRCITDYREVEGCKRDLNVYEWRDEKQL